MFLQLMGEDQVGYPHKVTREEVVELVRDEHAANLPREMLRPENVEFGAVQKRDNLVDLGNCCKMSI